MGLATWSAAACAACVVQRAGRWRQGRGGGSGAWPSAADWGFGNELSRVSLLRPSVDEGYIFVSPPFRSLLLPCCTPRTPRAAVAAAAAATANGMLALCHHAATALVTPAVPLTKPSPSQGPPIQPKAPPEHLRVVEDFLDAEFAGELRGCFDEHFAEPRQAHPMRFVWDYWHVPGQYTLHRTQAANYFSPEEYATQG